VNAIAAYQLWRRQRRPSQGNPTGDRILRGPGCNRHSRVCADASPPLPGHPGRLDSDGHRMRFRRHDGIYQSDVGSLKTKPEPNIASRQCSDSSPRTRREDQRSRPIVSMSSGRLFLDRVGRHQSPSPLHRRDQIKLVARSEGTIYHRTVTSALTGCLTFRDKPISMTTNLRNFFSWNAACNF